MRILWSAFSAVPALLVRLLTLGRLRPPVLNWSRVVHVLQARVVGVTQAGEKELRFCELRYREEAERLVLDLCTEGEDVLAASRSKWAEDIIDPSWQPESAWDADEDVLAGSRSTWSKSIVDSTWTPTDGFATSVGRR